MKTVPAIFILSMLVAVLETFISIIALTSGTTGHPQSYLAVRGEEIVLFGEGIYKDDSLFNALGFIAQDLLKIFVSLPLLVITAFSFLKKKGGANYLLLAILGYFVYASASISFGAAFNRLFLFYTFVFSFSLFAFVLLFKEIHFSYRDGKTIPQKGLAIFLISSGCITLLIWILPLLKAAYEDSYPTVLFHYTTLVTHAIDLAVIVPASIISGVLVWRKNKLGYKMALPLLGIIVFLTPLIILSTFLQIENGIILNIGGIIGPVIGFLILGSFGIYFLIKMVSDNNFSTST